jgi:hypothetical protein
MLMCGDVPRGSICTTDDVSVMIEELQFALGEGPSVDAYCQNRVVIESDLAHPSRSRWVAFTPQAVDAGVRAVFAFPLQLGTVHLGALDLYRDWSGPLTDQERADASVMAAVVARWVLAVQADAPTGAIADKIQTDSDFHFVVHNAAGAVSVQLGVSITEALVRLRAYAFGHNRVLRDVAEEVVTRRLRFGGKD